ncbi:MAG: cytochrome c biogenesis protein [Neomegalonema sp.]|nr:cytochrome c biogenesis protein [Neomegalonema sp.]
MSTSFWSFANPNKFMRLSGALLPFTAVIAAALIVVGLFWSLFATPSAELHGQGVKMLFVHVPAAFFSINVYGMMVVASLIGLVRSHPVSHLAAKSAAPIGAAFTLLAIVTGALWGMPGWGSYWEWDARLTSILILLFFYLGYIALWNAIEDPVKAADLAAILCLVGSIFAFLARYASLLFPTLHQGSSLSVDADTNVDNSFYYPLLVMMVGYFFVFVTLLLVSVRTEIRARRVRALRLAER